MGGADLSHTVHGIIPQIGKQCNGYGTAVPTHCTYDDGRNIADCFFTCYGEIAPTCCMYHYVVILPTRYTLWHNSIAVEYSKS